MKKATKQETLNVRIDATVKKKLVKCAERAGMSTSDYIREHLYHLAEKKGNSSILVGRNVVLVQEILNYVQEKYNMDEKLEGMVEKAWKSIQN